MTAKPVVLRERAVRDVEEAIGYYGRQAGKAVATRFVDRLEACLRAIGGQPALGSTRYAHELDLPGLRTLPLQVYPYLVFYRELDASIDVWRVLHAQRDVPQRLAGD